MKRAAYGLSLVLALLLLAAVPSQAGGRGHGGRAHGGHGHGGPRYGHHERGHSYGHSYYTPRFYVRLGRGFWWGPGWAWYGPPPAYARGYGYSTRVIVQESPVYVQRETAPAPAQSYWYYCESAGDYYPTVPTCPEPWVKVLPRTE